MKKYLAFISYRHSHDDSEAALGFRKGIEGYHLPKDSGLPVRRRVFRDTDELPTSADLGADIENALRDSEYLISLCSEEYVKSLWCMREVEFFLELGRRDRILPVLVSGSAGTSVPEMIRDIPIAADLRRGGPETASHEERQYDKTKIRAAVPEILSLMSGLDADSIAATERRFRLGAGAAAVAFITAGLLAFAGYATRTASRIADNNARIAEATDRTEEARKQAAKERDTALLRQAEYLSEQAWQALADGNKEQAVTLALSALPEDLHGELPVSAAAEGVLRMALSMEPLPSYRYLCEAETDFDIRGYYTDYHYTDRLILTGDTFGPESFYVDCAGKTGFMKDIHAESRQKAIDLGYTKFCFVRVVNSSTNRNVFCGPGKQMYIENFMGNEHFEYTLGGEPFLADGAAELGGEDVLAWEENSEGGTGRTALFGITSPEAAAELDLAGYPVSTGYDKDDRILIVDSTGAFSVFDYQGEKLGTLDGEYTDAEYYYSSGDCAYIASMDGTVRFFDLEQFREKWKIDCPSPVRQVEACKKRGLLLVRCDSGVYIYNLDDGAFVTEVGTNAAPNMAVWNNDGASDGNTILLIYGRRVELYSLDTAVDEADTDYRPLYSAGVPLGGSFVYSDDGSRIYQHAYQGLNQGEDQLYCWDAGTGELLWKDIFPEKSYGSVCTFSRDKQTIWRVYEGDSDLCLDQLDSMTGEKLLSVQWAEMYKDVMSGYPKESPDGTRAVVLTYTSGSLSEIRSRGLQLFDTGTGKLLGRMDLDEDSAYWRSGKEPGDAALLSLTGLPEEGRITPRERRGAAEALFSGDGRSLYILQNAERKKDQAQGICVDRFDAGTGELMEESFFEIGIQDITAWDEEECFVLIDPQEDEVNKEGLGDSVFSYGRWTHPMYPGSGGRVPVNHTVRIFDPAAGAFAAEVPFSYTKSPEGLAFVLTAVRPYTGGMALYWAAMNDDGDGEEYCCRLEKDGSTGTVYRAKSHEGRLLWVSDSDYLVFDGEEAYLSWSGIRRMSDAALLLGCTSDPSKIIVSPGNAPLYQRAGDSDYGIAAAKDGSSVCVFDSYANTNKTPFLILPSDLDTVVEKSRRLLSGK